MRYSFISLLTSDNYLPGLLVLFHSLKETGTSYPFLVLITNNISEDTITILSKHGIKYKILEKDILNPTDVDRHHRWFSTYSKIFVFGQTEYEKIVYLDADMLILRNIDELFNYSHMSATNAGSMLPKKSHWTHINSGLMVIEPSKSLLKDMLSRIGKIENLESGGNLEKPKYGSEQDFINAYFPDWPNQKELHLDHKYNIFHYHLDEYSKLFGYTIDKTGRQISIVHFASYLKPWQISEEEVGETKDGRVMEAKAIMLWKKTYEDILQKIK